MTGVLAAAFAGPFSRLLAGGAGLGVAAGLCYAAGDVGTKALVGGGTRLLFALPVMAAHGLGFVFKQLGFQRGGRTRDARRRDDVHERSTDRGGNGALR